VLLLICDIVPKYLHEPPYMNPLVLLLLFLCIVSCYSCCMCFGRYYLHCHHLPSGELMVHCIAYAMVRYYPLPLLCVGGVILLQLEIKGEKKVNFFTCLFFSFFFCFPLFFLFFFPLLIFLFFLKAVNFWVV
jgi:hypothetical protein